MSSNVPLFPFQTTFFSSQGNLIKCVGHILLPYKKKKKKKHIIIYMIKLNHFMNQIYVFNYLYIYIFLLFAFYTLSF